MTDMFNASIITMQALKKLTDEARDAADHVAKQGMLTQREFDRVSDAYATFIFANNRLNCLREAP